MFIQSFNFLENWIFLEILLVHFRIPTISSLVVMSVHTSISTEEMNSFGGEDYVTILPNLYTEEETILLFS